MHFNILILLKIKKNPSGDLWDNPTQIVLSCTSHSSEVNFVRVYRGIYRATYIFHCKVYVLSIYAILYVNLCFNKLHHYWRIAHLSCYFCGDFLLWDQVTIGSQFLPCF